MSGKANTISEATAGFLTGDEGRRLLEVAAALRGDAPARVLALRKRGQPPEIAAGAVELLEARRRARVRFPDADRLFFTAETLAQATSPGIAAYHARGLSPLGTVAELGCGVGIDSIALAEAGADVLAIERDPARLVFARANAEARGVAARIRFVQGDVTTVDWWADAAYWDPARRESGPDGRRVSLHADRYEPPLSFLQTIRERAPRGGCIKLSPALPDEVLDDLGGQVLFLSEGRECKEACVWWGEARQQDGPPRGAILLPERKAYASDEESGLPEPPVAPAPGALVFDPDPALIRARALGGTCHTLSAARLTPDDAYLTGDHAPDPTQRRAASAYRVLDALPYKPRTVAERLRGRGVGRLVVKKRHFPKEPDAVARELGLTGKGAETTLILARDGKGFFAILCEPL